MKNVTLTMYDTDEHFKELVDNTYKEMIDNMLKDSFDAVIDYNESNFTDKEFIAYQKHYLYSLNNSYEFLEYFDDAFDSCAIYGDDEYKYKDNAFKVITYYQEVWFSTYCIGSIMKEYWDNMAEMLLNDREK